MLLIKSFIKSHIIDVPLYFTWLLVTALIFQLSTTCVASGLADNDEFAEFDDPDDTFTVDLADPPMRPNTASKRTPDPDNPSDGSSPDTEKPKKDAATAKKATERADEEEEDDVIPLLKRKPIYVPPVQEMDRDDDGEATVESDEFEQAPSPPKVDEDEFEGFNDPKTTRPTLPKSGKPDLKVIKVPHHLRGSWDSYQLELLILSLLAVYAGNYFMGRTKNTQLAEAWFESHKPLLDTQFAMVGDDGQVEPGTGTLLKESEHLYSLWCSGRVACEAMIVELRLLKRQCLVHTVMNWLRPTHDTIVAKVIMEDAEMDGWVMSVGRKRRLQALAKDHQDLSFFCPDKRGQRHPGLSETFSVLSELTEATTSILNTRVCKFLADYEESIEYLFFSDQYTGPRPAPEETPAAKLPVAQKVLIFSFRLGSKGAINPEDVESSTPLFQFVFYIIDKVRRLRLSKESKSKSEKNRQRSYDLRLKAVHGQRQEAAQSRRDERVRANKERIMAEEDPDKARKLEEREQRKEKSKKMPKMKMVKY